MNNEIYQTENFIVEAHLNPFIPRTEGGHIRIKVKDASIIDRTKLEPKMAIELMRLTMVVGEALEIAMNKVGIPVIKINYQDMGNWAYKTGKLPFLHIHLFGRVANAVKQPWPESMYLPDRGTGFYEGFESLNDEDIIAIRKEIEKIFQQDKYQDNIWHL
jgi:diadenosine tetraphosphate (Ap4A) HIT family hydrolase